MRGENWPELLQQPSAGDHVVQVYQDRAFLCEAVAEYVGTGLRRGEGAILIARPAHVAEFKRQLSQAGLAPERAGEMVDVLWQRGERDAAIRLEEFWNDLARLQTFSLLCAYCIDNLDPQAYAGPLECVCQVHTHLIPAPDYGRFNQAVLEASEKVLAAPLAEMLLSLSGISKPSTGMPAGQATLLWLKRNMPRTADKVLAELRARHSPVSS